MKSSGPDTMLLSIPEADIRHQWERVRESDVFRSSKRCRMFLDYVLEQRLQGRGDSLREKVIGVEAFGRPVGYDSNDDPVVRIAAGEVRKRLAQYYQNPEHGGELRIELASGTYVPEFHWPAAEAPAAEAAAPAEPEKRPAIGRRRAWLTAAAAVGVAAIALAGWRAVPWFSTGSAFERFWAPTLDTPGPVLLCIGLTRVYTLGGEVQPEVERRFDPQHNGVPTRHLPPEFRFDMDLLVPAWDRYVPLGDTISMTETAVFLTHRGKGYRVRGSSSTSLADLKEGASVLYGAFSNDWTQRINKELRFRLAPAPDGRRFVFDRDRPDFREWVGGFANAWPEEEFTDYAILTRVFDQTTGKPVISIGGNCHLATRAAGEMLLSPDRLSAALRGAPAGWERRNLQIVIATQVIGSSASPPQFVALHVW